MSKRATPIGQRRIVLILALIAAAFILFFPTRQLLDQRGNIDALEQRVQRLRAENQRLEDDVSKLTDPAELEVMARERFGMVKPGEKIVYTQPGRPAEEPAAAEEPEKSWWGKAWGWLVDVVRGRD